MNRLLKLLPILVFLVLGAPSNLFSDEPDKTLHNKCLYPTVLIGSPESPGSGSGTIVRSVKCRNSEQYHNAVLTCGHLFQENVKRHVKVARYSDWSKLEGYDTYPCKLYRLSSDKDLGVVVFSSSKKMPCADIDFESKLYIGSDIFRIGCGAGDQMRLDFGKITSVNGSVGAIKNTYRMSIFTVPGDSGSAVFHKYKVVAITQAIRSVRMGWSQFPCFSISYSIPVSRFKKWNEELNNTLAFVYDSKREMPIMWDTFLDFESAKMNRRIVPKTIWEK